MALFTFEETMYAIAEAKYNVVSIEYCWAINHSKLSETEFREKPEFAVLCARLDEALTAARKAEIAATAMTHKAA